MEKEYKKYINQVLREIPLRGKRKKEIESDLLSSLEERGAESPDKKPIDFMGDPSNLAAEFRENLNLGEIGGFEYKSEKTIYDIPMVHINLKPNGVAKGILAIGPVAIGLVSVGAVAIGFLAFGAFTFGVLAALGAIAFSGIISMGAAAFSIGMSMGAVAMANYYAIGAFAQANIAIGSVAHGVVAIFTERGQGDFLLEIPVSREEVASVIRTAFPDLGQKMLDFVLFPFK